MISVVIPTLNESSCLAETLRTLFAAVTDNIENNIEHLEIIVVDGGSVDETVTIAMEFGVRVLEFSGGRAKQMNAGAAIATGDILLFLHGDTKVSKGFDRLIKESNLSKSLLVSGNQPIAGAFNLKINSDRWLLRCIEWGVTVRSKYFHLPYGDQAIFLKASTFHELGGFPELPIMEDFVFVRSLACCGKIAIVPAAVITSARRWEKQGIFKTTLINQLMILGYYLGISPERLRQWYRSGQPLGLRSIKSPNLRNSRYTQKQ